MGALRVDCVRSILVGDAANSILTDRGVAEGEEALQVDIVSLHCQRFNRWLFHHHRPHINTLSPFN